MKYLSVASLFALCAACSSTSNTAPALLDASVDAVAAPDTDAAVGTDDAAVDAGAEASSGSMCSAAIEQTLKPIDKVSTGAVSVVSDTAGVKVIYINAYAGGTSAFANNPYVYVNLDTAARVDLTDKSARTATTWDLAVKRYVIFTNSGDGGPGQGGAAHVAKAFDAVTAVDASALETESFFDDNCDAKSDAIGGLSTTFSDWYNYDQQTNALTPDAVTFIVRGGTGKLYKLSIESYYGIPDGGMGTEGGSFVMKVAAL